MTTQKTLSQDRETTSTAAVLPLRISQKYAVYNPDTRAFLLLEKNEEHPVYAPLFGKWDLPGGGLDVDEVDLVASRAREVREELGEEVDVVDAGPFWTHRYTHGTVRLYYLAFYRGGVVTLSNEHTRYVWRTMEEIASEQEYPQGLKDLFSRAQQQVVMVEAIAGWKRALADFRNLQEKTKKELADTRVFVTESVVQNFLPVLDNFRSAVMHVPEEQKSLGWVTGIFYIQKQLEDVLAQQGITPMGVKNGDIFDPSRHEAVENIQNKEQNVIQNKESRVKKEKKHREESATNVKKSVGDSNNELVQYTKTIDVVTKVVLDGYVMGSKVIRPARVVVEEKNKE